MGRFRPAFVVLAAASIVSGCGVVATTPSPSLAPTATARPTVTAAPTATPAPTIIPASTTGWLRHEVSDRGFALLLPPAWEVLDLTSADWQAIIDAAAEADPDLAPLAEQARQLVAGGGALFAFNADLSVGATTPTNVNVVVADRGGASLSVALQSSAAVIRQTFHPISEVQVAMVELPVGTAGRLIYEWQGVNPIAIHQVQFYVASEESIFVITFTRDASRDEDEGQFEAVAESFELLP